MTKTLQVKILLLTALTIGVALLVRFSYLTGAYVGVIRVRVEACDRGLGYWSPDGRWHWKAYRNPHARILVPNGPIPEPKVDPKQVM